MGLAHILNGDHQSGIAAYCGEDPIPACGHEPRVYTDSPQFYDSDDPWLHIYAGLANCAQRQVDAPPDHGPMPAATVGGHSGPDPAPTAKPYSHMTCHARFDTLYRFERAIELDPSNAMARELRAVAHLAHHGVEDHRSDDYFKEALETYPDPAALYRFRITLLTKAALWDAVVADYDVLIAIDAENAAEHHFQRGQAHSKLENRTAAEADYLKALELGYDENRVRGALTDLAR